ncbi:hypothetical protein [Cytobacillus oceanisediminis]|uniref:hypothetical protein n=1 Tax=Cytobacillus oceanisediminis TaxID=665099 RepID=UPI001FB50E4B|nr:hypothetical protein [Cytobacillus oceanisediminis]UOE54903.1 hypothetical protein IRB79_24485 [Cytobacillus oceanisediminis]
MINGIIKSIFDGYRDSEDTKKRMHESNFNELDETEFLFSSDFMNQMYFSAKTADDCCMIMNYLERYRCVDAGIESYDDVYYQTAAKLKRKLKEEGKRGSRGYSF